MHFVSEVYMQLVSVLVALRRLFIQWVDGEQQCERCPLPAQAIQAQHLHLSSLHKPPKVVAEVTVTPRHGYSLADCKARIGSFSRRQCAGKASNAADV